MNKAASLLPPEILQAIFTLACPLVDVQDPKGFVGRLGAVCAEWRAVVINSPELWSTFDLSFNQHHYGLESQAVLDLVELILVRSKDYPLSIRFAPKSKLLSVASIMTRLLAHSKRWQKASFGQVYTMFLYAGSVIPFSQEFPILQELSLQQASYFQMLRTPPKLKTLELIDFDLTSPSSLNIPWKSITRLSLSTSLTHVHMLPLFWRACSSLVTLQATITTSGGQYRLPERSRVDMPSLKSLTLEFPAAEFNWITAAVFATLRTRNLTELALLPRGDRRNPLIKENGPPIVARFLQQSTASLQSLHLAGMQSAAAVMILQSAGATSVKHLHLEGIVPIMDTLRALSRRGGALDEEDNIAIVPELESITISGFPADVPSDDVIEAIDMFVESRAIAVDDDMEAPQIQVVQEKSYLKLVTIVDTRLANLSRSYNAHNRTIG